MNRCLKCGYQWMPRITDPKKCPNCGQRRWWEPKRDAVTADAVKRFERKRPQVNRRFEGPVPVAASGSTPSTRTAPESGPADYTEKRDRGPDVRPEPAAPSLDELLAAGKVGRGIETCGHRELNREDGEMYSCGLAKGHRGKHGKPEKTGQ